ncbi:MAG: BolA family transcriptional regulator [Myxococcales bacterium]|nr:BolA family transcriptional regulator [Myxococcales bacterium]
MSTASVIEEKLRERFAPSYLLVENESGNHSVPRGSETHFRVVLVSGAFAGRSRVERHRLVYDTLGEELKRGVHALALVTKTAEEWAKDNDAGTSPPCLGGSKAEGGAS